MRITGVLLVFIFAYAALSCSKDQVIKSYSFSYAFADSLSGWKGGFADHGDTTGMGYHLYADLDILTYDVNPDSTKKAIRVSGINKSNDLFMYIKRKISGLRKNTSYKIMFNVRFASNARTGGPGENVYFKVGASTQEPVSELVSGNYRMNIDKGSQGGGGENMIVVGHIGVNATTTKYTLITRFNTAATSNLVITTNDEGELWLIIGTDSALNDTLTTLYYTQVDVVFNEAD